MKRRDPHHDTTSRSTCGATYRRFHLVRSGGNTIAREIIETMRNGGNSLGGDAAIYEECSFLVRNFAGVKFFRSPREGNIVAHILASNADGP
jgi:hypothetical protein